MTNSIEQTKFEMYKALKALKAGGRWLLKKANAEAFEAALEAHLEALRQDRIKFTEKRRNDLERRLAAVTEERDEIQGRLHAVDHAHFEQSQRSGEQAKQIEKLEELNRIAGEELIRVQAIARQHLDDCRTAEKLSDDLDEKLRDARVVISQQEQLIVGQRLAIADLYMSQARAKARAEEASKPKVKTVFTMADALEDHEKCQRGEHFPVALAGHPGVSCLRCGSYLRAFL